MNVRVKVDVRKYNKFFSLTLIISETFEAAIDIGLFCMSKSSVKALT